MTFLEILERLKDYVHCQLVPELNDLLESMKVHMDGVEDKYRQDLADYIATVEARFAELAETYAKLAVDEYLADPSTIDNAVALKIKELQSATRKALDAVYLPLSFKAEINASLASAVSTLNASLASTDTALRALNTTTNQRITTMDQGMKARIQSTPVDPGNFLPLITIQNKKASAGYRYEVIIVHSNGTPRPGIVRKMYANNFHLTAPKGDMFVVPNGDGETMVSMAARSGADIVSSSVGWQTSTEVSNTWAMRGPQIKDGVIYRDFELNSNRGRHALGVHDDGRILPYRVEDGDTAQKMVDAGVIQAFGFGPLLVFNGAQQNVEAISWSSSLTDGRISARTILGVRADHSVVLIEVIGQSADNDGVGGNNMAALAFSEGCINAVLLDGGGSTQAVANGITFHPSSDNDQVRDLGEGLLLYGRLTSVPDSSTGLGPTPLKLAAGFKAQSEAYAPGAILRAGQVSLVGGVAPTSGLFPANTWVVIGEVPDIARPKALLGSGAIVPGAGGSDEVVKIQVRSYGEISIRTSVATGYVNLHGASYAGL